MKTSPSYHIITTGWFSFSSLQISNFQLKYGLWIRNKHLIVTKDVMISCEYKVRMMRFLLLCLQLVSVLSAPWGPRKTHRCRKMAGICRFALAIFTLFAFFPKFSRAISEFQSLDRDTYDLIAKLLSFRNFSRDTLPKSLSNQCMDRLVNLTGNPKEFIWCEYPSFQFFHLNLKVLHGNVLGQSQNCAETKMHLVSYTKCS